MASKLRDRKRGLMDSLFKEAEETFPNDAIFMVRVAKWGEYQDFVKDLTKRSSKTEKEMVELTISDLWIDKIKAQFQFIDLALDYLKANEGRL